MPKKKKAADLVTAKVTKITIQNFNIVAAVLNKNQYEVIEEASRVMLYQHLPSKK